MIASLRSLFEWVDTFPSSIAIRESQYAYPVLLTSHVLGMCLFAGLIIMMDLRLLGVGNMRTPFTQIQRSLFAWQMIGMTIATIAGGILVYSEPLRFYGNVFFWVKMVMVAAAGVNAIAFHFTTYNSIAKWDAKGGPPLGAKVAGAASIALWASVVVTGRLIAYNWFSSR